MRQKELKNSVQNKMFLVISIAILLVFDLSLFTLINSYLTKKLFFKDENVFYCHQSTFMLVFLLYLFTINVIFLISLTVSYKNNFRIKDISRTIIGYSYTKKGTTIKPFKILTLLLTMVCLILALIPCFFFSERVALTTRGIEFFNYKNELVNTVPYNEIREITVKATSTSRYKYVISYSLDYEITYSNINILLVNIDSGIWNGENFDILYRIDMLVPDNIPKNVYIDYSLNCLSQDKITVEKLKEILKGNDIEQATSLWEEETTFSMYKETTNIYPTIKEYK